MLPLFNVLVMAISMYRFTVLLLLVSSLVPSIAGAQKYNSLYPVFKYVEPNNSKGYYKVGYMNADSKLVIDYLYNESGGNGYFIDGYTIVTRKRKKGIIDTTGKIVFPFIYNDLKYLQSEPLLWEGKIEGDSIRLFDEYDHIIYEGLGTAMASKELDRVFVAHEARHDESFAVLMDHKGNRLAEFAGKENLSIVPVEQHSDPAVYNKKALMLRRGASGALLDIQGKVIYDSVLGLGFQKGEMAVNGIERAAVIDTDLKEVVPFSAGYEKIELLPGMPYYFVHKNMGWGLVDKSQRIIVDFKPKCRLGNFNSEWVEITSDFTDFFTYYNYKGEKLLETKNRLVTSAGNRFPAILKKDEKEFQLWKSGEIGKVYHYISPYNSADFAYFYDGEKSGLLDSAGHELFTCTYDYLALPENGVPAGGSKVRCNECDKYACAQNVVIETVMQEHYINQYFYLDMKGERNGKETYDLVYPVYDGQQTVEANCRSYLLDGKDKKELYGQSFYSQPTCGVRIVRDIEKKMALLNKSGKLVSGWVGSIATREEKTNMYRYYDQDKAVTPPALPERVPDYHNGLVIFTKDHKYGLMDSLGHIKVKPEYKSITYNNLYYAVDAGTETSKLLGVLDTNGNMIIRPNYTDMHFYGELNYFVLVRRGADKPGVFVLGRE